MKIYISKLNHVWEGYSIALEDPDGNAHNLGIINGNIEKTSGPVVLLSIDQHVLYGMSHPIIISRILNVGPQDMIATKDMAHNLFEHGMKCSLGLYKWQNKIPFITGMFTFYNVVTSNQYLSLVQGESGVALKIEVPSYDPIVIYDRTTYKPKKSTITKSFCLNDISNYITINLLGKIE